jgi:AcrR family transcriptional regulator
MTITSDTPRPRGRPRNQDADREIVAATLRLLCSEGYDRTSIEAVAAEAHVTRATVYRRYATKADMVTAAVCTLAGEYDPEGSPDARATVTALLRSFHENVGPNDGISMVASLYLQRHEHPEMLESFRERVILPCRQRLAAVLELARERGDLRTDVNPAAIVEMLIGSYLYRTFAGLEIPADWAEQTVAAVWPGLTASE